MWAEELAVDRPIPEPSPPPSAQLPRPGVSDETAYVPVAIEATRPPQARSHAGSRHQCCLWEDAQVSPQMPGQFPTEARRMNFRPSPSGTGQQPGTPAVWCGSGFRPGPRPARFGGQNGWVAQTFPEVETCRPPLIADQPAPARIVDVDYSDSYDGGSGRPHAPWARTAERA